MRSIFLAVVLACLPVTASAQTAQAAWKCGWFSLCLPKYDPPIDAMRVWVDDTLNHERRPMWYAAGGRRTSDFVCGPTVGKLSVSMVRSGQESARSTPMVLTKPDVIQDCAGTPRTTPLTIGDIAGPKDILANLAASCLADARCAQLVLSQCMSVGTCKSSIATKLSIDVDADGAVTPTDQALLDMIVQGTLR